MTRSLCATLVLATISSASAVAHAGQPDVYLEASKPNVNARTLRATIDGGPRAPLDQFELRRADAPDETPMHATRMWSYAEGNEPIAIAFVVLGEEIWVGNDSFETDENARYRGTLPVLSSMLARLHLGDATPAGSQGVVVSYSTGAEVRLPLGPISRIDGQTLGRQLDYRNKIGTDMVQGIQLGMAELQKSWQPRKAMIIIGDGNDTNNEVALAQLPALKRDAARRGIQIFSITYKSAVSSDENIITKLDPRTRTVNSCDGIGAALESIVHDLCDRYYVEFDAGAQPWDGTEHDYVMRIGHEEIDPITMNLPKIKAHHWSGWRWLARVGLGIGGLGLLLLLARLRYALAARAAQG